MGSSLLISVVPDSRLNVRSDLLPLLAREQAFHVQAPDSPVWSYQVSSLHFSFFSFLPCVRRLVFLVSKISETGAYLKIPGGH